MFRFETCAEVPRKRHVGGGGGLVKVEDSVVWGPGGGGVFQLDDKDQWKKMTDEVEWGATLAVFEGSLVALGGMKDDVCSKKVMVWRGGRWSLMTDMLIECRRSSAVSIAGGGLVVMGGIGDGKVCLNAVQVFDSKTWHFGPPLLKPCWDMTAVVHGDQVFMMGGYGMARAVWYAKINDLVSH